MKTLSLVSAAYLLLATTQHTQAQANKNLSNLTSPTAINQPLLPNATNNKDLGANNKRWRNFYLGGKIGLNINPAYPVDVSNTTLDRTINVINPTTGESIDRTGIYSSSIIADFYGFGVRAYGGYTGVFGSAEGGASQYSAIGVYGNAFGAENNGSRYGVYGFATSGTFNAAGYFNGAVYASSYNNISDRKFKTNIAALKTPLESLMKLKPSMYEFKTTEFTGMELPKGRQIGLIADEVKQVFPELVNEAVQPAQYGKDKSEVLHPEVKYESVNYIELIPVLIASVQQQQKTIAAQQEATDRLAIENEALKARLEAVEKALGSSKQPAVAFATTGAYLGKATPNPASQQTAIDYYLPQYSGKGVLNISDMNGVVVKSIAISAAGKGQITIDTRQYAAGTYSYTLVVNGQAVDSKKLVVAK